MRLLLAIAVALMLFAALFALALHFNVPRDFAALFASPLLALMPLIDRRRGAVDAFFLAVASLGFAEATGIVVEYIISDHPAMGFLALLHPSLTISVVLLVVIGRWIGRRWILLVALGVALVIVRYLYDRYVVPPSPFFGSAPSLMPTPGDLIPIAALLLGATIFRTRPSAETSYSAPR